MSRRSDETADKTKLLECFRFHSSILLACCDGYSCFVVAVLANDFSSLIFLLTHFQRNRLLPSTPDEQERKIECILKYCLTASTFSAEFLIFFAFCHIHGNSLPVICEI